ncbi:DUF4112 domain-containing protein [Enterovirga sp.]|jgi:hypothetical protein|uniref:DUF4112 domain-containing protein n=1 Tax=Enterovirga sp. TaxID=2026350 RepID=UPI0026222858|nr:DUF4112 domain-containing protein [Enterovirga sp.]MDB5591061.1 hypothetical protein [Enterovirga sp.]
MAAPYATFNGRSFTGPADRDETLARLDALSRLLDSAFVVPGTNVRFGIDGLIGLVPGIGDLVSCALSSYLIWEARRLGLPRWKIARMIGNVAFDTAIGVVPFVGDVADVMFKANRRNMRIIRDHIEAGGGTFPAARQGPGPGRPGVIDAEYHVVERAK